MRVETHAMSRDDALALVERHHVGRCGIGLRDVVRVELTPYVYADGWIYVRAMIGEELEIIRRHPWAAFEVDEIDGVFDWRSVEMSGAIEVLAANPDGDGDGNFEFDQALRHLRATVPELLTADDPRPEYGHLLRIHVDTVRGRESRVVDGTAPRVTA